MPSLVVTADFKNIKVFLLQTTNFKALDYSLIILERREDPPKLTFYDKFSTCVWV